MSKKNEDASGYVINFCPGRPYVRVQIFVYCVHLIISEFALVLRAATWTFFLIKAEYFYNWWSLEGTQDFFLNLLHKIFISLNIIKMLTWYLLKD